MLYVIDIDILRKSRLVEYPPTGGAVLAVIFAVVHWVIWSTDQMTHLTTSVPMDLWGAISRLLYTSQPSEVYWEYIDSHHLRDLLSSDLHPSRDSSHSSSSSFFNTTLLCIEIETLRISIPYTLLYRPSLTLYSLVLFTCNFADHRRPIWQKIAHVCAYWLIYLMVLH